MEGNLEKITDNFTNIPITESCLRKIKTYAELSKGKEIYGFLLNPSEKTDGIVRNTIIAYNQEVSGASVHLDGLDASLSKTEIENLGMKTIGFWHSHAGFGTFHSPTDDTNLDQLYRDIAQNNEERIHTHKNNIRYFDQANGKIIYQFGGYKFTITPQNPEKLCEKRILSPQSINFPEDSMFEFVRKPPMGLYLRDKEVILELDNIKEVLIHSAESEEDNFLGLAYSLVVNEAGSEEYGEIAEAKWCGNCQETKVKKHVKCKAKIIDDTQEPTERFSPSELEKEISERTKKNRRLFSKW